MFGASNIEFLKTLTAELVPALGCTEPIAIAYAAAAARDVLGEFPEQIRIACSGDIVKNAKSVEVPNSGGLFGIDAAAVLGVVGGKAELKLEVLSRITPEAAEQASKLLKQGIFSGRLQTDLEGIYIEAAVRAGNHTASVTIINRHTLITRVVRDGKVLYEKNPVTEEEEVDWSLWSIERIVDYAQTVPVAEIKPVLDRQIHMNSTIADAGLTDDYGAGVGRSIIEIYGENVQSLAKARAAAGSDARMSGCSLPVVINSGSGNQGMTVSLPVIEYAKHFAASDEQLYRALVISNLVSIYVKHHIGRLSAFCGAVTAASGTGAAITYLAGGSYEQICGTLVNTLANVGGILCDGAKPSCAAKIASSVDSCILAHQLSMNGKVFKSGEGLVKDNIETTLDSIGYVGSVGMKITDEEILRVMTADD